MRYLLDTGVLLRLVNREAAEHHEVRAAVRVLKAQGHVTVMSFQNLCEFWNVCTRPETARGGLGLTVDETRRRLRALERVAAMLPDSPDTFSIWKRLVLTHGVKGTQVHDAKLVALMNVHAVSVLLTLNAADFRRYPGITPVSPQDVLAAASE